MHPGTRAELLLKQQYNDSARLQLLIGSLRITNINVNKNINVKDLFKNITA